MNFKTPLPVDSYGRFMSEAWDERSMIGVSTGFAAFFGRPETGGGTYYSPDAAVVAIDIIRSNGERMAMLIDRGSGSRLLSGLENTDEQKYTSITRLYPLAEENGDINADQLNFRLAGENPYQSMTRLDRLRMLAMNQHNEHIRRMVRLFEYLCSLSILTGKHPAILGTTSTDLIYNFLRNADNTEAVTTGWNQSGATIMVDIDDMCRTIRKNGHVTPDMLVIGGDAMEAFVTNLDVQTVADNRRFELIEVGLNNPVPPKFDRFVEGGFIARGRLRTPQGYNLWIFTYIDGYTNLVGDYIPYMPVDQALIAYSGARCDRYFGPPEVLPMSAGRAAWYQEMFGFSPLMPVMPPNIAGEGDIITPAMFYCDAYQGAANKTITLRTQSAPIFASTMTDCFGVLTDLIT